MYGIKIYYKKINFRVENTIFTQCDEDIKQETKQCETDEQN